MGSVHWFDVVMLVIAGFYVWYAWGKGVYESIAEMLAWVVVWLVVLMLWRPMSDYLVLSFGVTRNWAPFVALLFLVSFVGLMMHLLFRELAKKLSRQHFSHALHLLIGVPINIVSAGLMVMLLLLLFVSIPALDYATMHADTSWFVGLGLDLVALIHG
jgi:hypothetical protein